ncbi:MAG: replicative DNA helicase [Rikenellaceae bacterium]
MAKTVTSAIKKREKDSLTIQEASQQVGLIIPNVVEIEEAVLGALMLEKNAILQVQDVLRPESFYVDAHQTIYQAVLDLSAAIQPIDLLTVGQQLQRKNELQKVGGPAFLAALTQKIGSAAHLEFHAKIVAQKFVQRELITAATEIQKRSFSDEYDIDELINMAESQIFNIAEGNIKRDMQTAKDVVAKAILKIEEAAQKPDGLSGVPSGFAEIDRRTLGWQQSDLIIIAARPSMGKTAFVLTLARNISVGNNIPVAFFSLEMSSVQLIMRLIMAESGLEGSKLKNGRLSPDEWKHLEGAVKPLSQAKLFIDDTPALSIFEFRSKARRLKLQHNIEIIVIDYLQLMTAGISDGRGSREQEVSMISRSLKAIAKDLDVPIIALSQLNRAAAENSGGSKRPQLSHLRESGAIEQDADIVAFIHRPEYYGMTVDEEGNSCEGLAEFIFAKHRNGAVGIDKLRFVANQAKFIDWIEGGFATQGSGEYAEMPSAAFSNSGFDDGFDQLSAAQGRVEMKPSFPGGNNDLTPF